MTSNLFAGAYDLSQHSAFGAPAADDLTKTIDLLDSEVNAIAEVYEVLRDRVAGRSTVDYDAFQREIKDRFAAIGFVVEVVWYHTNVESVKTPEIVVRARTEAKVFDRDQMVHEVTHDVLGTGDAGVIKVDKATAQALEEGTYRGKGGHRH